MKKFLFLLPVFFLAALQLHAQTDAITRFFSKYSEDERFTTVFISQKMFQLVAKVETDDEDWNKMRDVVKDLGGLRILTCDTLIDGVQLYKEALGKVPISEYSELLTVRDGQENVRIWIKEQGNTINELLLLVGAPDEFVMLSFVGKIDVDKISSLSKTLDVKGAEHLDKIKTKD
jgi:hypothetical protein